jgi:hypothetical protein
MKFVRLAGRSGVSVVNRRLRSKPLGLDMMSVMGIFNSFSSSVVG